MNNQITTFQQKLGYFNTNYLSEKSGQYRTISKIFHDDKNKVDQFLANLVSTFFQQPELIESVNPESLIKACLKIAELDLSLAKKQVYLIPYGKRDTTDKDCQFQISYMGFIKLASDAGIRSDAELIYSTENIDDIEYIKKNKTHKKDLMYDIDQLVPFKDTGKKNNWGKTLYDLDMDNIRQHLKGGYCVLTYKDSKGSYSDNSFTQVKTMRLSEIIKKAKTSKTFGKEGFYLDWFEEMLKKTIFKYALKTVINDSEIDSAKSQILKEAVDLDNQYETQDKQSFVVNAEPIDTKKPLYTEVDSVETAKTVNASISNLIPDVVMTPDPMVAVPPTQELFDAFEDREITQKQYDDLEKLLTKYVKNHPEIVGITKNLLLEQIKTNYNLENIKDINIQQYDETTKFYTM